MYTYEVSHDETRRLSVVSTIQYPIAVNKPEVETPHWVKCNG